MHAVHVPQQTASLTWLMQPNRSITEQRRRRRASTCEAAAHGAVPYQAQPHRPKLSFFLRDAQVITEQRLVEASEHFEAAAHGDRAMLRAFCEHKAGEVSGAEAETWAFLRILFEDNATECAPLIDCRQTTP